MSAVLWLAFGAVLAAIVVLTRATPRGGRPVAGNGWLKAAHLLLIYGVVVCGGHSLSALAWPP